VVEPTAPIIPDYKNRSGVVGVVPPIVAGVVAVGPAISDSVNNVAHPGRTIGSARWRRRVAAGVVRPNFVRDDPANLLEVAVRDVGQNRRAPVICDEVREGSVFPRRYVSYDPCFNSTSTWRAISFRVSNTPLPLKAMASITGSSFLFSSVASLSTGRMFGRSRLLSCST